MKLKPLIKKFSYNELLKTCEKEGWKLPSSKDVEGKDLDHEEFWISDLPEKQDRASHACIYNKRWPQAMQIANKHFLLNAVVIVEEKVCENCKHSYSSYMLNPTHCKVVTFPYFCEVEAEWEDMPLEINKDFGCNKFERKEN